MHPLRAFVLESNAIEGIHREPTRGELDGLERFLSLEVVTRPDVVILTMQFQPDALLRDEVGLDVTVGPHRPPPGGPEIPFLLDEVVELANAGDHPYGVHHAYETAHPFTDGNGRGGRALWLWGMRRGTHEDDPYRADTEWRRALHLGFLHTWYYQSLQRHRRAS